MTDDAAENDATEDEPAPESVPAPAVDPMKGFRGVMAATLILEAIVVALSLLVVAKLYGGLNSTVGFVVGAVAVVLVVACGLLRRSWIVWLIGAAQVALLCCFAGSTPVGVIGVLFTLIWGYLLWLRWDVARRMATGRLPSQQPTGHST
ncbi:MAG TPA: DUF4233 domain-containing protein [Pseudonocardiaceae bacterium]|jgi:hypothetical protein